MNWKVLEHYFTHIVLGFCFFFLRLTYPKLPIYLDCPCLIIIFKHRGFFFKIQRVLQRFGLFYEIPIKICSISNLFCLAKFFITTPLIQFYVRVVILLTHDRHLHDLIISPSQKNERSCTCIYVFGVVILPVFVQFSY